MGEFAQSSITVNDLSVLSTNSVTGVNALIGVTERGAEGETYLCRNWEEYTRNLGGLLAPSISLFPLYCKRILDAGGIIRVGRAFHYTDIDDVTTNNSLKANGSNAGIVAFSGKVISFTDSTKTIIVVGDFTNFLSTGDSININLPNAGGTTADTVVSVNLVGGNTVVVLTSFVAGNVTLGSTLDWNVTLVGDLSLQAKDYGFFANDKLWFKITEAASGLSNVVDIHIGLDGYSSLDEVLTDVSNVITSTNDLQELSDKSRWVNFLSNTLTLVPTPRKTFTFGIYNYQDWSNIDVIGSVTAGTGIHMFDNTHDFVRLSIPEFAQNSVDNALVDYCIGRQDCLPFLRVPTGLTATASIDYRNCRGAYAGGTIIDAWQAIMLMSDIVVEDEYSGTTVSIPSLPDTLALATLKDNRDGAWGSFSGIQNNKGAGIIRNTTGVGDKNLNSPTKLALASKVTAAGLIPVIDKKTNNFGNATMVWGNSTMQLAQNTLLRFANIAELVIYMQREIKPILDENLFEPNDPLTWKNIYRRINAFMRGLQGQRAISEYEYIGDQNADTIADAVFNTQIDILNGIYKFKVIFIPVTRIEKIEATFTIVDNTIGVELTNA